MDDQVSPVAIGSRVRISDEERMRRRAAIDYARGSVRLEGFVLEAEVEALNRRYINGEITSNEHSAAVRAISTCE